MVKLTVLYNLPEGADHEEFVKWRTTAHQKDNASKPGVLITDFYIARDSPMGPPKYRYITEVYYETMADLNEAFFSPANQAQLKIDCQRILEPVFVISEERSKTVNNVDQHRGDIVFGEG